MSNQLLLNPFTCLIVASGPAACLSSAYFLPVARLDLRFLLIALVTICFSSRLIVTIPRVKGEINVSDTFIFLTLLLYGGEAAVLLAAAESLVTSQRFCKKRLTVVFNVAMMSTSTFLTVLALRLWFGNIPEVMRIGYSSQFVVMVTVMSFVQYGANAGIAAVRSALRTNQTIWYTWSNGFLWTSITYFAGASAAAIIAKLMSSIGVYAFAVTAPIIAIVYFTYRTYLKNVEASQAQAEAAQNYVEEMARQMSEQESISRKLQVSEEHFRSAFDHAAGMALVNTDGWWLQVNRSLCAMLGYSEEEMLATRLHDLTHPEDLGHELVNLDKMMSGTLPSSQLEKRLRHKSGHYVWVLTSASVVRDAGGKPTHFIFQIQDITERKRAEEQVQFAAFHDALTRLPNRVLLSERLSLAVERAKRKHDYQFAVLFIDLDRFKVINDSLGHTAGDQLLVEIARRLERCLRTTDTVARLGGDEFAILLDGTEGPYHPTVVAERIQQQLALSFDLGGHEVYTSASIGIAFSITGYDSPDDILRDSDTAMYRAKANGKAGYEVFGKEMHTRAVERLRLENDLRRAVERNEFEVHYQPVVFITDGRVTGFEALARWRHPERGLVAPVEFIPLAEETGLIIPLGLQILRQACKQAKQWQRQFPVEPSLTISVNLSAKQFQQPDLVEQVEQILQESGIKADCLYLEVTESTVMENAEEAEKLLGRLNDLGIQLALDDFGTGYSSLSYLHRFPFDALKIDRSFISHMGDDLEAGKIVKTIMTLASELKIGVTAEGVESEKQQEQLASLGCQYAQGYLYSRPLGTTAAQEFLLENVSARAGGLFSAETPRTNDSELIEVPYPM